MDHLIRPCDGIRLDGVPVFESALYLYDGAGFEDFPNRIAESFIETPSWRERASFVQGWLYFGLLRELLGKSVNIEEFIRPLPPEYPSQTTCQWLLTTAKLPDYIQEIRKIHDHEIMTNLIRVSNKNMTRLIQFVVCQCSQLDRLQVGYDDELPAILLSIRILTQSLDDFGSRKASYRFLPRGNYLPNGRNGHVPLSIKHIHTHMVGQTSAWCPHQVQTLFEKLTFHALVYLAEIRRSPPERIDHTPCATEDRCMAYNIDDETFQGSHVDNCSGCPQIEADSNDMMTILEQGDIPIIKCERSLNAPGISLSFVKATSSTHYTAISHVWSDGLGSRTTGSLPHCQLDRLLGQVLIAETHKDGGMFSGYRGSIQPYPPVSGPVMVWLDVYCVPSASSSDIERTKRAKSAAISRMVPTYALAQQTLVLDHELRQYKATFPGPLIHCCEIEFYARAAICGWRSRCWTHQEAQVSKKILVQCCDSLFHFAPLEFTFAPEGVVGLELFEAAFDWLGRRGHDHFEIVPWRQLLYLKSSLLDASLADVWSTFNGRSTSRPRDAATVFASTLRLSVAHINSLPVEDRMRTILRAAIDLEGGLPAGIFFLPTTKSADTGELYDWDRWVPRFPGEGGDLDEKSGILAKAVPLGFSIPFETEYQDFAGCFGLRIRTPGFPVFHVPFNGKLLEVSLCGHKQPAAIPEEHTHLFLLCGMPPNESAFEGVGACLIPVATQADFPLPPFFHRVFFSAIWYCPIRYRQIDESSVSEEEFVQITTNAIPREAEKHHGLIIRSSWQQWEKPKSLGSRKNFGMTLCLWGSIWPFLFVLDYPMSLKKSGIRAIFIIFLILICPFGWLYTACLLERARWIILMQSYSKDFEPSQKWFKRLIEQLEKTPGQNRFDRFFLKVYAYWPWLITGIFEHFRYGSKCLLEYLWHKVRYICGLRGGQIRLDERHGLSPVTRRQEA